MKRNINRATIHHGYNNCCLNMNVHVDPSTNASPIIMNKSYLHPVCKEEKTERRRIFDQRDKVPEQSNFHDNLYMFFAFFQKDLKRIIKIIQSMLKIEKHWK